MGHAKTKPPADQLNVRSVFARTRATQLGKRTGMSTVQVVEEALRAYQPAPVAIPAGGLIEKHGLLVKRKGRAQITQAQIDAELDDMRSGVRR
jgi:hypothetical protein